MQKKYIFFLHKIYTVHNSYNIIQQIYYPKRKKLNNIPNLSKVASNSSKYLFITSALTADLLLLILDAVLFNNWFLITKFEIQ